MPAATVTIRDLKNKDTGIDLSITGYKEVKAMIGSTYQYHITVVTNLSCFKSPKHKESDNVQFMVPRKFNDFEELWTKMNVKYSGTAFPPLPKKVLMVNDVVAKERWNGLDYYLKFLAMTPKLCTSSLLLTFLGVNPMKTGRMASMEVSESIVEKQESTEAPTTETQSDITADSPDTVTQENLFDEEVDEADDVDTDLFTTDALPTSDTPVSIGTKLFDDPDLGGAIPDEESADLFLADALSERTSYSAITTEDADDDADELFKIDDNLDAIMDLNLRPKEEHSEKSSPDDKSEANDVITPPVRPKPVPRPKPNIPSKPKISNKPDQLQISSETDSSSLVNITQTTDQSSDASFKSDQSEIGKKRPVPAPRSPKKPPMKQKPMISKKPLVPVKPKIKSMDEVGNREQGDVSNVVDIGEDDILKYIQENTAGDDDGDLFS